MERCERLQKIYRISDNIKKSSETIDLSSVRYWTIGVKEMNKKVIGETDLTTPINDQIYQVIQINLVILYTLLSPNHETLFYFFRFCYFFMVKGIYRSFIPLNNIVNKQHVITKCFEMLHLSNSK